MRTNDHDAALLDHRTVEALTRLADGSLLPERVEAARSLLETAPEADALLAAQEGAVRAVRALDEPAPPGLRARIEGERHRSVRPRLAASAAVGLALAALVLALALALPGGSPGGPTVSEAAALALRVPWGPAPAVNAAVPALLRREVDEVPFPNWAPGFGWRAIGVRDDTIRDRRATTVFYTKGKRSLAYTIVGSPVLAVPAGAGADTRGGTQFRTVTAGRRVVVTWRRRGHTCVLSAGPGVGRSELLALASWRDAGSLPY